MRVLPTSMFTTKFPMKHLLFAVAALLCLPVGARAGTATKLEDLPDGALIGQAYVVRGVDFIDRAKADPKMVIESVADGKRTDALYLIVMFANPSKDGMGVARVTYTFTMIYPDGTKQASGTTPLKGQEGALPAALQKTWVFATAKAKLPLNDKSPVGTYKFNVVVKDMISGTEWPSDIEVMIK